MGEKGGGFFLFFLSSFLFSGFLLARIIVIKEILSNTPPLFFFLIFSLSLNSQGKKGRRILFVHGRARRLGLVGFLAVLVGGGKKGRGMCSVWSIRVAFVCWFFKKGKMQSRACLFQAEKQKEGRNDGWTQGNPLLSYPCRFPSPLLSSQTKIENDNGNDNGNGFVLLVQQFRCQVWR